MERKTIEVEYLKTWANIMLETLPTSAEQGSREVRLGIFLMLEEVLVQTDNYKGFRYLDTRDNSDPLFDSTRRYYF